MDKNNILIPSKKNLIYLLKWQEITWNRKDCQRGTNCIWERINFIDKKWNQKKLFVKKSFLKISKEVFENDYILLKKSLRNIIPNQRFVWFWNNTFVFCSPISIQIDVFEEKNTEYLKELLQTNKRLLKQVKFFIRQFEILLSKWKILDLYWKENLVISDDNRLYYIDSLLVFHNNQNMIVNESIRNIEKLKAIVNEIQKNQA